MGSRLDHGEGDGEVVGLAQVNLLVRHVGERGGAVRAPAALPDRREFRERDVGARICGGVDHRRDDALGAEIERAARGCELADRNAHDRSRSTLAHLRDSGHDRGGVPQSMLPIERDRGKALAADELGDDRRG